MGCGRSERQTGVTERERRGTAMGARDSHNGAVSIEATADGLPNARRRRSIALVGCWLAVIASILIDRAPLVVAQEKAERVESTKPDSLVTFDRKPISLSELMGNLGKQTAEPLKSQPNICWDEVMLSVQNRSSKKVMSEL